MTKPVMLRSSSQRPLTGTDKDEEQGSVKDDVTGSGLTSDTESELSAVDDLGDTRAPTSKQRSNRKLYVLSALLILALALTSTVASVMVNSRRQQQQQATDDNAPISEEAPDEFVTEQGRRKRPAPTTPPPPPPPPTRAPSRAPSAAPIQQIQETQECSMPPMPGKKGACLTLRAEGQPGSWVVNLPRVVSLNPSWNYSWNLERIAQQPDNIEFVPMAWSGKSLTTLQSNINSLVLPHVQSGKTKRILAFNEPDKADQANMSVDQAIAAWPVLASAGVPMVGPSTVNARATWAKSFDAALVNELNTNAALDPTCDDYQWVGVHWYGGASFSSFVTYLTNVKAEYPRQTKLIITEFAPADWTATSPSTNKFTTNQVLAFAKQALPWMEATEWIAGYAWFPFSQTSSAGAPSALFDGNGDLTRLGRYYASVTPSNPSGNQSI